MLQKIVLVIIGKYWLSLEREKGEEKIPLQLCDIILPNAHIQTKQGYVSGFHLLLFCPSSFSFSPGLQWEEEHRGGRTPGVWKFVPSQPWTQHHTSSAFSLGGCLFLSVNPFPLNSGSLSVHLLSVSSSLPCSATFLREVLEKPASGIY